MFSFKSMEPTTIFFIIFITLFIYAYIFLCIENFFKEKGKVYYILNLLPSASFAFFFFCIAVNYSCFTHTFLYAYLPQSPPKAIGFLMLNFLNAIVYFNFFFSMETYKRFISGQPEPFTFGKRVYYVTIDARLLFTIFYCITMFLIVYFWYPFFEYWLVEYFEAFYDLLVKISKALGKFFNFLFSSDSCFLAVLCLYNYLIVRYIGASMTVREFGAWSIFYHIVYHILTAVSIYGIPYGIYMFRGLTEMLFTLIDYLLLSYINLKPLESDLYINLDQVLVSPTVGFFVNIAEYLPNLITILLLLINVLLAIAITTLLERKVMSSIQRRRGPNVIGLFGFLQPIADGLKLFLKEIVIPSTSNPFLFLVAPCFTFFCSLLLWQIIPFDVGMQYIEFEFSLLYLLAISSLSTYGIIFSGWSSNSKYAFFGGLRSTAQMISYEIIIGLVCVCLVAMCNSFNIVEIVHCQEYVWFIFPLLPMYIIFFISALAETNRAPFDLPEAEAELVAGYNVEYSSIAFALFFLGEYSNIIFQSAICTLFFFGGWLPIFSFIPLPGFVWFALKVSFHVFAFVWVRASFPRYRYDQLMKLGWKVLLPLVLIQVILLFLFLLFI